MDAQTTFTTGDELNPMELRILAWVCGDASPAEAAELERLTAAHPEWAEVRRQLQGVGDLLGEAAGRDPEPLRLSPRRRTRLLRNLMPRKNTMISFAIAVSLIAGVAVYGERTHYVPPVRVPTPTGPVDVFKLPPPEPDPVDDQPVRPAAPADLLNPQQLDAPVAVLRNDAFPQPLEPPPMPVPTTATPIGISDGVSSHRTFDLGQLDIQPVARYQARAAYPYAMRERGLSGEVLVEFIVDPNGEVRNATAVRSSEHGFEDAAVRAVSRWKFRPGRKGGVPVYTRMQVPIVFTLDPSGD